MNVNYILEKNFLKINGEKIYFGDTYNDIKSKTSVSFLVSAKEEDYLICTREEFQLHFKKSKLFMWTISPEKSFFRINKKKIMLNKLKFNRLIKILFIENIKWEFNQELTFLDQVTIRLENNIQFIFKFDIRNKKGVLGKVQFTNEY